MHYLFYIWAVFAILFELSCLLQPGKMINFKKRIKNLKWDAYDDTAKNFAILSVLYLLWVLAGLFSSSWKFFLALVIISCIPKKHKWIIVIDSAITLVILLGMIINRFHYHFV